MSTNSSTMTDKKKLFLSKVEQMKCKHLYMSASKLSNTLTITGAVNKFKRSPDVIYVPKYRLVGTKEEINAVVQSNGLARDLGKYYTAENYLTTMKEQYEAEVEARKNYKESLRESVQNNAADLIENIDKCTLRMPSIFSRSKPVVKRRTAKNRKKTTTSEHPDVSDTVTNDDGVATIGTDEATNVVRNEATNVVRNEATNVVRSSDSVVTNSDSVVENDEEEYDETKNDGVATIGADEVTNEVRNSDSVAENDEEEYDETIGADEVVEKEETVIVHLPEHNPLYDARANRPNRVVMSPRKYKRESTEDTNRSESAEDNRRESTEETSESSIMDSTSSRTSRRQRPIKHSVVDESSSSRRTTRLRPIKIED